MWPSWCLSFIPRTYRWKAAPGAMQRSGRSIIIEVSIEPSTNPDFATFQLRDLAQVTSLFLKSISFWGIWGWSIYLPGHLWTEAEVYETCSKRPGTVNYSYSDAERNWEVSEPRWWLLQWEGKDRCTRHCVST
jgi:hypothetical protein